MNNSKKAIIHIGTAKTETSGIQSLCYNYRQFFLSKNNLFYPDNPEFVNLFSFFAHHYLSFYFSNSEQLKNLIPKKIDKDKIPVIFENLLKDISNDYNLIISSETFSTIDNPKTFIEIIKRFYPSVYIVFYVRNQVEAHLSMYQTEVIRYPNTSEDFRTWYNKRKFLFDYYSIAQRWEQAGCKVIVKPYKRDEFPNGDIVLHFTQVLSSILEKDISLPSDYDPSKFKVNITVPGFITMIGKYYNTRPTKDKILPLLADFGLKLKEILPDLPTTDFVPPSVKRKIVEEYRESNRLLCERYLGMEYLGWLNKDIEGADEEWSKRFNYEGSQLVELIKTVLRVIESYSKERGKYRESIEIIKKDDRLFQIDNIVFMDAHDLRPIPISTPEKIVICKPSVFIQYYMNFFCNKNIKKILELGTLEGGSAIALAKALNPLKIVGVDIANKPYLNDILKHFGLQEKIKFYFNTSQVDKKALLEIIDREFQGSSIDLVIDDASHAYDLTKKSFEILFPKLREYGFYVIEDWGWTHYINYDNYRKNEPALTNFIFELTMAHASNRQIFNSVYILDPSLIIIQKGGSQIIDENHFSIDSLIRIQKGRKFNLI